MSSDSRALRHCLTVHTEPDPNALARVTATLVVHGVLPSHLTAAADDATRDYVVAIVFTATAELARRLGNRIAAILSVRRVMLDGDASVDSTDQS